MLTGWTLSLNLFCSEERSKLVYNSNWEFTEIKCKCSFITNKMYVILIMTKNLFKVLLINLLLLWYFNLNLKVAAHPSKMVKYCFTEKVFLF